MAEQNKSTLKNYFQTGDIPSQAQYADLIDSQLNLAETGTQTVAGNTTVEGNLSSSNIISSNHITASGNISASGNVIANTVNTGQGNNELYAMNQDVQTTDSVTFASITSSGDISASGTIFADNFQSTGGDVAGISFTDDLNLTGDLTASGTISANIISASGGVDAAGFTINGIAVGTSTDTFWETGSSGKISYNAGNVGIGTLDPGEKLEVVGNISASGTGSFSVVTGKSFVSSSVNSSAVNITMTEANYPGGSIIGLDMDNDSNNDIQYTLPALTAGLRYTFLVNSNAGGGVTLTLTSPSSNTLLGVAICDDGNEDISGTNFVIQNGRAFKGTRLEVVSDGTIYHLAAFCLCNTTDVVTTP